MEKQDNKGKFSLELNVFDTIILLCAVALGGFLLWQQLGSQENTSNQSTHTIRYTILMNNMNAGSGELVVEGSSLHDVVKKYHLGTVISKEITPAVEQLLDHENRVYRTASLEGFEDVYVVMEAEAVDTGVKLVLDGGYDIRVGQGVYMQGAGYMAAGQVVDIDRSTLGGGT